jgi:hypothetical protein
MLTRQNSTPEDTDLKPAKTATPDYKTLQRLRTSCRVMLERYIDVTGQSSGNLASLTPGFVDPVRRANLALLKQKEDRAHDVYLKARTALLDYLCVEDEAVDTAQSMASGGGG